MEPYTIESRLVDVLVALSTTNTTLNHMLESLNNIQRWAEMTARNAATATVPAATTHDDDTDDPVRNTFAQAIRDMDQQNDYGDYGAYRIDFMDIDDVTDSIHDVLGSDWSYSQIMVAAIQAIGEYEDLNKNAWRIPAENLPELATRFADRLHEEN